MRVSVEGRPAGQANEFAGQLESVSSDFLRSMHMPLLAGRFLSEHDRPDTPRVVVVSAAVARKYWPDSNPVGQRIKVGSSNSPWVTVVGVSGDMVRNWLTNRPSHLIYVPYTQTPLASATFVVRTMGDPQLVAPVARDKMREIDQDLPIYAVREHGPLPV